MQRKDKAIKYNNLKANIDVLFDAALSAFMHSRGK